MSNLTFPWGEIAFIAVDKPVRSKKDALEGKPEKFKLRLLYDNNSVEAKELKAKLKDLGLSQFGHVTDEGKYMVVASSKHKPSLMNESGETINSSDVAGFNSSTGDTGQAAAECMVADVQNGKKTLYLQAVAVKDIKIAEKTSSKDIATRILAAKIAGQ
jgi:hypothetical protein